MADNGFANDLTGAHDFALQNRKILEGTFHAEIASRHHDGISLVDDGVNVLHGVLILDFSNDLRWTRMVGHQFLQQRHISGRTHEGEREVINVQLQTHSDIGAVFFSECWEINFRSGKIDVAAVSKFAAHLHFAFGYSLGKAQYAHPNEAAVDEDDRALFDVIEKIWIINAHTTLTFGAGIHGKIESITFFQLHGRR